MTILRRSSVGVGVLATICLAVSGCGAGPTESSPTAYTSKDAANCQVFLHAVHGKVIGHSLAALPETQEKHASLRDLLAGIDQPLRVLSSAESGGTTNYAVCLHATSALLAKVANRAKKLGYGSSLPELEHHLGKLPKSSYGSHTISSMVLKGPGGSVDSHLFIGFDHLDVVSRSGGGTLVVD